MKYLIQNGTVVNEGLVYKADVVLSDGIIAKIIRRDARPDNLFDELHGDAWPCVSTECLSSYQVIDATGLYILPGAIDDQVHFREPGLTQKAEIYTESKAAVAGGVTSFMDMPNTKPQVLTQELLQQKYDLAAEKSLANYSFYMGASNDNIDEVVKTNPNTVCGIKVFMGSSTGNMLVDNETTLANIFQNAPCLVATHCEDEAIIKQNTLLYKERYGSRATPAMHPLIRSAEACYKSSSKAVELAERYGTRLHVLHLTTAREMSLFHNDIPLEEKKITAEVCFHHLWFNDKDYDRLENFIKCNPAIKTEEDRQALLQSVMNGTIDVVATDHAPHTFEEKCDLYFSAPGGMPMVQHSLCGMLEFVSKGIMNIEKVVELMCHNPATLFQINKRGFLREGYAADVVLVDPNAPQMVANEKVYYKCGWTPLNGTLLHHSVTHTFVNGNLVYERGLFHEEQKGQRILFNRK